MIIAYIITGIATVVLYVHGTAIMTSQSLKYTVDVGSLPVNTLLFYFLAGFASDRLGNNRPRWVGWAVFSVCMIVITLVLRVWGGYRTVLG